MKAFNCIQIVFFIFITQLFGCKPAGIPRSGPHELIVAELDNAGYTTNLSDTVLQVMKRRLIKMGLNKDSIELSAKDRQITIKIWHPEEQQVTMKRIHEVLTAHGKLEFWKTYNAHDVIIILIRSDSSESDSMNSFRQELARAMRINYESLKNNFAGPDAQIGYALSGDTPHIDSLLHKMILPMDMHFIWGYKRHENEMLSLYALKGNKSALSDVVVTKIEVVMRRKDDGNYGIDFTMDGASGIIWQRLTRDNKGKTIAIVMDGRVCVCPIVQAEIPGGRCSISGSFSKEEAEDMVALLDAGSIPSHVKIVEEKVEN